MIIHIFIINPIAGGRDRSEIIRKFLARKENFQYLVFDTDGKGQEREIVERMLKLFEDDLVRFYICGGSGTFMNALSGIRDMSTVEVAHFPCGSTNDFIKVFGRSRKYFYNMDNLIRGAVMPMDYIKCEGFNAAIFISMGMAARVEKSSLHMKLLMSVNSNFIYSLAFLATFLWNPSVSYIIEIDGEDYSGDYGMVYVGNGLVMGGVYCPFKNASPVDGKMEVLLLKKIANIKLLSIMKHFQHGELELLENDIIVKSAKKVSVRRKDEKDIMINSDGDILYHNKLVCELAEQGMNFVVPRGSELYRKSMKGEAE
jgi:diacylglycerol kinase (ATP)